MAFCVSPPHLALQVDKTVAVSRIDSSSAIAPLLKARNARSATFRQDLRLTVACRVFCPIGMQDLWLEAMGKLSEFSIALLGFDSECTFAELWSL